MVGRFCGVVTVMTRRASVALHDVTLGYDRHPVVHHLQGDFAAGSLTAVIGPNGAGKSTLLKAIAGFLTPLGGTITIKKPNSSFAYLPQSAALDRDFPITVEELVGTGLWRQTGAFRRINLLGRHRITETLAQVGLTGFERRIIGALSGGQIQRALFARLMLQDADLILMDEPFAAIDDETVNDLMRLIQTWHHEGRTVITVLHDMARVRAYFPDCLILARDRIAWGATDEVLTEDNLAKARLMAMAQDTFAEECERAA
jgi:zinc/manganese transport system ATP-binding protein